MNDLIHANVLIGKLHNTAFKDGDDRSIVYSVIEDLKTVPNTAVDYETENRKLHEEIREYRAMIEAYEKADRDNNYRRELSYRDGLIEGLKFAIRANGISGENVK